MLETYKAILHGNQLEWTGSPPATSGTAVPVHVTILDEADIGGRAGSSGEQMAAALRELADIGAMAELSDPATWQREVRRDRPLPGRE